MALNYTTYNAAYYTAKMTDAQKKKIFNMEGMASVQAQLRTWVDHFVVDTINALPAEKYLDQTKTQIVPSFAWSAETYPNTTNPNLDGKPVLVFAVKGITGSNDESSFGKDEADAGTAAKPDEIELEDAYEYSFVALDKLVDTYTAKNDTSKGVDVTISDDCKVSAELNISATEGNAASLKDDGLFVAAYDDTTVKSSISALETLVGHAASTSEGGVEVPASGLVAKIASLETLVGDGTTTGVAKDVADIKTAIGTATDGETPGTGIVKDIEDINTILGKLGTLANKSAIKNEDVAADAAIAVSKISGISEKIKSEAKDGIYKEADEQAGTNAQTLAEAIAALETALGEGGSVSTQITTEIEKLDATVTNAVTGENAVQPDVVVSVTEEDGKLTAVTATVTANRFDAYGTAAGLVGVQADAATSTAATGVYAYVDSKMTNVTDSLNFATPDDIALLFEDPTPAS